MIPRARFNRSPVPLIALSSLLVMLICPSLSAPETSVQDNKIKAVFIYRFIRYIQWPSFAASKTFDIAVLGDSDMVAPLREIAKLKSVDGKRIRIKQFAEPQNLDTCHILFVSASMASRLEEIPPRIKGKNILTISDKEGLANRGISINFIVLGEQLKFQINRRALERAGLKVSSQLIKLAILVEEEEEPHR